MPKDKPITVTKVEGREDFLKKLTTANPQMKPLLDQILSEDALKQMADADLRRPAQQGSRQGRHLGRDQHPRHGADRQVRQHLHLHLRRPEPGGKDDAEKKWDKISVDDEAEVHAAGRHRPVGGLPFKIKSADLTSKDAKGNIFYDADKGRIVRSRP